MRLLIIQESGHHAENAEYREALVLQSAMNRIGHEALVWGQRFPNDCIDAKSIAQVCDAVLLLENYSFDWLPDLSTFGKPLAFWSIDAHLNLEAHLQLVGRFGFDLVLCAVHSQTHAFDGNCGRVEWLPNAYPADLIQPDPEAHRRHRFGFCGSVGGERAEWAQALRITAGLHVDHALGEDMVQAIQSYGIHWNRNAADDINYRTFETLGAGTMLLTNPTSGLNELFDVGRHLETYQSVEECADKARWYSAHDAKREAMARRGHQHAQREHTYDKRAERIVALLEEVCSR